MDFIAFDLETTGTVAGVNQIIEIGAVKFINGEPAALFATLVDPGVAIPPGASAVNGISDDMVKGKPKIDTLLESLTEFCGDTPLVAHNANFDAQFLIADFKKHEFPTPRGVILDTLPIARRVLPGLPNYRLGTLVQHLKITAGTFHRAEDDATACGRLFQNLCMKISVNNQAPGVQNLVALTGKPAQYFPVIERKPKQLDLLSLF
ncbi:MAG: DNA polymerase III subunit epsilon [Bdellovibrio sp. SCN 50-8]|nr:MAG: DNA polymerase III subunit epsilon [Bdellovibrio sp. SCN 50-8]